MTPDATPDGFSSPARAGRSEIVDGAALADELAFLRKGRGARHPQLLARLGPHTRALLAIESTDSAATARHKLTRGVHELLRSAPADLLLAATAALALRADADHRRLTDRYRWIARELVCDERTARRRVAEAFDYLLDAAGGTDDAPGGREPVSWADDTWAVREFRAVFRLDTPTPEATEHRRIVARTDGVGLIVYPFSLYRDPKAPSRDPSIIVEALYGVRLAGSERPVPDHFRFLLHLPRRLRRMEEHEYGLRLRLPPGQPVQPLYVYTPVRDCDQFDLTVRFDAHALPSVVWVLNAALPIVVDHDGPTGHRVQPDQFGEVRVQFRELRQGLGYGLRWSVPPVVQR